MKHSIIAFIIAISSSYTVYSQTHLIALRKQDTLLVSDIKTTHLLFNENIRYLDIGSPYFVADTLQQKMIRLKHIGEELEDTRSQISNLTVITEDGGYYSIAMGYYRNAATVTYKVKKSEDIVSIFKQEQEIEEKKMEALESLCDQINKLDANISIKSSRKADLRMEITGFFYTRQEKIGIRIDLTNKSTIDFDIDQILFRTKLNKRLAKDYLYQERVITPIYTCAEELEIISEGRGSITLLFNKFMLNENEKLSIDIFEANGGRTTTVHIPREKLLKPKII